MTKLQRFKEIHFFPKQIELVNFLDVLQRSFWLFKKKMNSICLLYKKKNSFVENM